MTARGLTTAHVEGVITQMRKDGVSEQTIFKMYKKLRQILKRPTITGHIDFNPCDLVTDVSEPPVNPTTKEKLIDMLFYHIRLHCYVALEVKAADFDSSYMGQLGTYVVAVNHQLKTDEEIIRLHVRGCVGESRLRPDCG